jgi:hypothetical protein
VNLTAPAPLGDMGLGLRETQVPARVSFARLGGTNALESCKPFVNRNAPLPTVLTQAHSVFGDQIGNDATFLHPSTLVALPRK